MEVAMKKLLVILFIILAGLLLFSCKSSTSPDNDVELDTLLNKDVIAVFTRSNYSEESYALITIKQDAPSEVNVLVKGVEGTFDYMYHSEENGTVFYRFLVETLNFGEIFSYVINIDREQFSGTIKHPDKHSTTFPKYDMEKDYSFKWSLASNPQYQAIHYWISGYTDGHHHGFDGDIDLKSSARKHTLKKSMWSDIEVVTTAEVFLFAYNTKTHGDQCTVAAYSEADNFDVDKAEWRTNNGKLPKGVELLINRLEK